ncbi:MAG: ParB N-terminal domain-containing protein [Patescibacteria group bacterium]|nr:ParB N-terminal domain-containing protein [Patescibacteria group bacterium]
MQRINFVPLPLLKAHEKTSRRRLRTVRRAITSTGYFTHPIMVDRKNLVILDGHHRTQALREIGAKRIPACMVDYRSHKISVRGRRSNVRVSKTIIIRRALAGKLFPCKTSRHTFSQPPKQLRIRLKTLL